MSFPISKGQLTVAGTEKRENGGGGGEGHLLGDAAAAEAVTLPAPGVPPDAPGARGLGRVDGGVECSAALTLPCCGSSFRALGATRCHPGALRAAKYEMYETEQQFGRTLFSHLWDIRLMASSAL